MSYCGSNYYFSWCCLPFRSIAKLVQSQASPELGSGKERNAKYFYFAQLVFHSFAMEYKYFALDVPNGLVLTNPLIAFYVNMQNTCNAKYLYFATH